MATKKPAAKPKPATKPVARKPSVSKSVKKVVSAVRAKVCSHEGAHYQGDFYEEDGTRMQRYLCPTCGQEVTKEAEDA